jgi:probable HAF family extracellular repeat protein
MKRTCIATVATLLILVLTLASVNAQEPDSQKPYHHHYKLIDLGTFGGPHGGIVNPSSGGLSENGMLVGASDTAIPDPYPNMCFADCYVNRGVSWHNGVEGELPPLPGGEGLSNIPGAVNSEGQAVGQAQNGAIDPVTGWPESRAVIWQNAQAAAIATLGGTQAIANAINSSGQVVGASLNSKPDPFANSVLSACSVLVTTGTGCSTLSFGENAVFFPGSSEAHAFLWHKGSLRDLGTLGGPDSIAWVINDRGEVAGWSFTSFAANDSTGVPTVDPFLWSPEGGMTDLGSLGGTFGSVAWLNNRGQVVGASNLPGDTTEHPYIWSKSEGMRDLGTLGGTFGHPDWVNDAGEVVGFTTTANDAAGHAFLWRDGVMTDLGTIGADPDSESNSINSRGQIAGSSGILGVADLHAFLGENNLPIVDLNTLLVPPAPNLTVITALLINDRGEIGCIGTLPNGDSHPCLLIPCDEAHPDLEGCDYNLVAADIAASAAAGQLDKPVAVTTTQTNLTLKNTALVHSTIGGRHRKFGGFSAY